MVGHVRDEVEAGELQSGDFPNELPRQLTPTGLRTLSRSPDPREGARLEAKR